MYEELDLTEVPFLDEIIKYLPIDPIDEEDINSYISNLVNLIIVNYKYAQYQFSYFGLHLLYMTYIYCTVWKISIINPERYKDAVLFARPYERKKIDLEHIKSIFEYSNIPEKELPKIFKIIDLNGGQMRIICDLVDTRNEMAHASGKFEIVTEEIFYSNINAIYSSIKNIHRCMDAQIRKLFSNLLIDYANEAFKNDYSGIIDIIEQEMIQINNLSIFELLVCNEMSVKALSDKYPKKKEKFNEFKSALKQYCIDNEYISIDELEESTAV